MIHCYCFSNVSRVSQVMCNKQQAPNRELDVQQRAEAVLGHPLEEVGLELSPIFDCIPAIRHP